MFFKNRLTIFIFFMLIAVVMFGTKHYLREHQQQEEFTGAAPASGYSIKRELPHREAREPAKNTPESLSSKK